MGAIADIIITLQSPHVASACTLKMKKIEIKAYTSDELSKDVQKKVLDEHRYIDVDGNWFDPVIENWTKKLASLGFTNAKIHFTGFGSQGDGACFDAEIDILALARACGYAPKEAMDMKEIIEANDCRMFIFELNGRYSHEHMRRLTIEESGNESERDNDTLELFQEKAENLRINLSKEIYRDLYTEYDYLTDNDQVSGTIIANDYYFLANGKLAPQE